MKQFLDAIGLGGKTAVIREGSVKIDSVERFETGGILGHARRSCDGVDEPWLTPDVASVKDGFAMTLEYYGSRVRKK